MAADEPKPHTPAELVTIPIPASVAQLLLAGLLAGLFGAGGGYLGAAGNAPPSPDVFAERIATLSEKVTDLQADVKELTSNLSRAAADRYTGAEARRDHAEIERRLGAVERQVLRAHPDLAR